MKKPTREKVGSPLTMYRMALAKRAIKRGNGGFHG